MKLSRFETINFITMLIKCLCKLKTKTTDISERNTSLSLKLNFICATWNGIIPIQSRQCIP